MLLWGGNIPETLENQGFPQSAWNNSVILITYTRVLRMTCTGHRILGNCKEYEISIGISP